MRERPAAVPEKKIRGDEKAKAHAPEMTHDALCSEGAAAHEHAISPAAASSITEPMKKCIPTGTPSVDLAWPYTSCRPETQRPIPTSKGIRSMPHRRGWFLHLRAWRSAKPWSPDRTRSAARTLPIWCFMMPGTRRWRHGHHRDDNIFPASACRGEPCRKDMAAVPDRIPDDASGDMNRQ